MADNINRDNIDDIVSGVRAALESGNLDDGVRFEFAIEDEADTMLVFENEESEEVKEEPVYEQKQRQAPEVIPEQKPSEEKRAADSSARDGIWTTYVPRFTSASDNYHMKNGMKEREEAPALEPKKVSTADAPLFTPAPDTEKIDPTAELDSEESISGATLVGSNNTVNDSADISKVFKFEGGEAEPVRQSVSEEEVIRRIDEILSPESVEPETEEEAVEVSEEESECCESESESEPEEAILPAPIEKADIAEAPVFRMPTEADRVDEDVDKKKNREYTAISESDSIIDSFIDSITSIRVRLFAAALLALVLLFVENASWIGINLVTLLHLEGVGGGIAMVTLPFIVGLFLLSLPEVAYSFAALVTGKLLPEFFITVSFAVISFYYATVISFSMDDSYFLFGFIYAVMVIFAMLASYSKKKAEFSTFKIISARGEKLVVDRKLTRNLPLEHRALDGVVESYKSRTARVFRTGFVSDFFARKSIISENARANLIILVVSLGIALVGGVFAFFIPGGIVCAARTFALVYTLALPSFILISHKIPYAQATAEAVDEKSAFIGEKALFEYSGVDVITFDDTEIFTKDDVNLQRIMVYGKKENLPKALAQMSALFTVVGGPLAYIFADAVDRRVVPADNVAVDTDGIIGRIDGAEVMAGSAAFMQRHGIEIPYDPSGEGTPSQSTRIMYAAESGEIYAKFYVRYMLSEDFTMILPLLLDDKIRPLVYTRDPNIDNSLFRSLTAGQDSIRVLKKQNLPSSEIRLYSRISLGMVSVGDKTNIINSILLSKRYASLHAKLSLTELPVVVGGALLGLLLSLLMKTPVPSLILSLWYVGWSLGVIISGRRIFERKKEKNKDKV